MHILALMPVGVGAYLNLSHPQTCPAPVPALTLWKQQFSKSVLIQFVLNDWKHDIPIPPLGEVIPLPNVLLYEGILFSSS